MYTHLNTVSYSRKRLYRELDIFFSESVLEGVLADTHVQYIVLRSSIASSHIDSSYPGLGDMQNTAPYQHRLAIVYRRLNGPATLEPVIVSSSDTGQRVFEIIKGKQHEISRKESRLWFFNPLLTRLEVGIAEIRWVRIWKSHKHETTLLICFKQTSTDNKTTEISGTRVELKSFEQYNLFSEAIRHPVLLANEPDFLTEYGSLALGKPDGIYGFVGQQVLVVYPTADKEKIAWLLLLALILSPALGLIVGQFTHRAEVGVAVGAGVFACASFLQGLAAWLHK